MPPLPFPSLTVVPELVGIFASLQSSPSSLWNLTFFSSQSPPVSSNLTPKTRSDCDGQCVSHSPPGSDGSGRSSWTVGCVPGGDSGAIHGHNKGTDADVVLFVRRHGIRARSKLFLARVFEDRDRILCCSSSLQTAITLFEDPSQELEYILHWPRNGNLTPEQVQRADQYADILHSGGEGLCSGGCISF